MKSTGQAAYLAYLHCDKNLGQYNFLLSKCNIFAKEFHQNLIKCLIEIFLYFYTNILQANRKSVTNLKINAKYLHHFSITLCQLSIQLLILAEYIVLCLNTKFFHMINQNWIDMQDISKKMQNFCNSFQLFCLCIQNNCSIAHGQNQNKVSKKALFL